MITVHRHYSLPERPNMHTHFEVNPTGRLEVEIIELNEKHSTEFEDLSFESTGTGVRVCGKDQSTAWRCELQVKDALELSSLVEEANEEYEALMRDLMY